MRSMIRKSLLVLPLFLLWVAAPAFCLQKITIPCEVMEVSKPFESSSSKLNGVRYILLQVRIKRQDVLYNEIVDNKNDRNIGQK